MVRPVTMFRLSLSFFLLIASLGAGLAQRAGLSLTDAGRNAAGVKVFELKADNADAIDVLRQIFSKTGNYDLNISPEVRGSLVTLSVKGATVDDLIDRVRTSADPPIFISTAGRTVFVTRSSTAASRAEEVRRRMEANQFSRLAPGIVPSGLSDALGTYRDAQALETPVTLVVPEDKSITLSAALQAFEKQTRVPLRLDPSLPADIKFMGSVTRVPLRSVLQNIAPGGDSSLKVVQMSNQILIAPADRINVVSGIGVLSSTQRCSHCQQPLLATWRFCPNCGQTTKRGLLQGYQLVPGARKVKQE